MSGQVEVSLARGSSRVMATPTGSAAGREAQLRERDLELGAPALGIAHHLHVPHGVPAVVVVAVVEVVAVGLHAHRVHGELVGRAPVVERVDGHLHPVGWRAFVAPREHAHDPARLAIERLDGDVERRVVVGDAGLGALGRRAAFGRLALHELANHRRIAPHRLVEASVDHDRRPGRHGLRLDGQEQTFAAVTRRGPRRAGGASQACRDEPQRTRHTYAVYSLTNK